ncbi:sigma-70 family RNA polymerase sigma factor [Desulfococcaceae bacterium HSG9]|nr:sigma-70 family RNA polymerase sigma factor [Desulfococcaceae bacterium HSG9]
MAHKSIKLYEKQLGKHWSLIYSMAYRKFTDTGTAEEAITFVTKELGADDWHRLRQYKPVSKFKTYLMTVVSNLLIDFTRKKYGRKRVPEWIQKRGVLWNKIYTLLCIKGQSNNDVAEQMADDNKNPDIVEEAIWEIKEKVTDCGKPLRPTIVESDSEPVDPVTPEDELIKKETEARIKALNLSSKERLLLKLIYKEGNSVSKAGRMLGLNADQAHGRHRRLLIKIRQELEREDFFQE